MTALARPILIKRTRPEMASTPAAGLRGKLYARVALFVILAFSSCSLIRVIAGFALQRPTSLALLHHATAGQNFVVPTNYQTVAAMLSFRLHYYRAAAWYLSDAINKRPQDGHNRDLRALAYWKTGKVSLAQLDFEQAVKLDPKDSTALKILAWLLSSASRPSGHNSNNAAGARGLQVDRLA